MDNDFCGLWIVGICKSDNEQSLGKGHGLGRVKLWNVAWYKAAVACIRPTLIFPYRRRWEVSIFDCEAELGMSSLIVSVHAVS